MSFKSELETARADAERRLQRQREDQAKQAKAAHIMVTDPDRYWAEYSLTDELVIQSIRGSGSFHISLPEASYGHHTAARLDEFRAAGAEVRIVDTRMPGPDDTASIPVKTITVS